jgi:cellulose biosynthesis protein BcsQ
MLYGTAQVGEGEFFQPARATALKVYQSESGGTVSLIPSTIEAYKWIIERGYPLISEQISALSELIDLAKASGIDYVLLDTPPEPTPFLVAAAAIADAILIPVDRSRSSIRGMLLTLYVLNIKEVRMFMKSRRVLVVFNKFESREKRVLESIRSDVVNIIESKKLENINVEILKTVIPRRRVLEDISAMAFSTSKPLIRIYLKRLDLREPSWRLAKEIIGKVGDGI